MDFHFPDPPTEAEVLQDAELIQAIARLLIEKSGHPWIEKISAIESEMTEIRLNILRNVEV